MRMCTTDSERVPSWYLASSPGSFSMLHVEKREEGRPGMRSHVRRVMMIDVDVA